MMEPISFSTSDSSTFRGTGLHAIGRIFGHAAVDVFLGRGVILVVRQESGNTPVSHFTSGDKQKHNPEPWNRTDFFAPTTFVLRADETSVCYF